MADDSNSTFVPDTSNVVTHPREQMRLLREKLAEAAQRLIDAMDAIDGDPDTEPSLGAPEQPTQSWRNAEPWARGVTDDREDEFDGREDGADDEPSLGSPNLSPWSSQEQWAPRMKKLSDDPYDIDRECDFPQTAGCHGGENQEFTWVGLVDEGEPDQDLEPSTALENIDQTGWLRGSPDDCEPSLGSTNSMNQTEWGGEACYGVDLESQCEDEGVDTDSEPDETDCWHVNPHSLNQDGMRWIQGETPTGLPDGPRFVPGI